MPGGAVGTGAAAPVAHHDRVARPDPLDGVADPLDDAGALVPEHDGIAPGVPRKARPELPHGHVRVTDAAGDEPDQDLVRARLVELDLLERERTVGGLGDGGFDDHRRTI